MTGPTGRFLFLIRVNKFILTLRIPDGGRSIRRNLVDSWTDEVVYIQDGPSYIMNIYFETTVPIIHTVTLT